MRTRKHIRCLLVCLVTLLAVIACSPNNGVKFDPSKPHHGDGRFLSEKAGSFFSWVSMRWKEDSPPEIDYEALASIVGEADRALINFPAHLPRATWIGHATVLVQYREINFLTDPFIPL